MRVFIFDRVQANHLLQVNRFGLLFVPVQPSFSSLRVERGLNYQTGRIIRWINKPNEMDRRRWLSSSYSSSSGLRLLSLWRIHGASAGASQGAGGEGRQPCLPRRQWKRPLHHRPYGRPGHSPSNLPRSISSPLHSSISCAKRSSFFSIVIIILLGA